MTNVNGLMLATCRVCVGQPTIYELETMVTATALTAPPFGAGRQSDRSSSKWGLPRRFGNGGAAVQRSSLVDYYPFVRESTIQLGGSFAAAAKTFVCLAEWRNYETCADHIGG
jgi:hypothetical protein